MAVLGIWKSGAGYVALDPDDDVGHFALVVEDSSIQVVVTRDTHCHVLPAHVQVLEPTGPAGPGTASTGPAGPGTASTGPAGPGDVAMVFYGSGPSRVEHAVVIEHRSVVNLLAGLRGQVWPSSSRLTACLSAKPTDDAFVRQVMVLAGGHALCVAAADRPHQLVALLATAAIDLVDVEVEMFEAMRNVGLPQALAARPAAAAVATLVIGSRRSLDRAPWSALGQLPGLRSRVVYGPPECCFGATVDPCPGTGGRVTIGRPMANVRAKVVSPHGKRLAMQVTGELHMAGACLARGHEDGRTGQRARLLPDGRIELLGTLADFIDLGGFGIDRSRMEAALCRHPGVNDVRVEVRRDEEGRRRLVADVEAGSDAVVGPDELRVFLWSQLAGYAWPAEMRIVEPDLARRTVPPGVADDNVLAGLWAATVGVDRVDGRENYWQAFSFLEALDGASDAGLHVRTEQVTRNRTIATLAADLAAERLVRARR